jgi:hypothetical protein
MADETKRKGFYTPQTKVSVVKQAKVEPAADVPFVPVDIERVLADGRVLRRQCNRPDLEVFARQGFKPVKIESEKSE